MTSSPVVRIHPGEQIEEIKFQSTVAPMCTYPRRFVKPEKCCLDIEFDLKTAEAESGTVQCDAKQGIALHLVLY